MNILIIITVVCLILIILGLLESKRECKSFVLTHYHITNPKLNKLTEDKKVIVLSDLHNKEYGEKNIRLLDAIRKEEPDMIWIAGDMLIGKCDIPADTALYFMKEVSKIAPVYYGNGNHEQRLRDFPEFYGDTFSGYKEELLQAGVIFLENQNMDIMLGDNIINIAGFELPNSYYKKGKKYKFTREDIENTMGSSSDKYQVLLAHYPGFAKVYANWGADLVLSGHLHGGIIRLPFIGAVITPQVHLFPQYSGGHYRYKDKDIVVSKGIGEHTINLRFLNKPEVIVLHIGK